MPSIQSLVTPSVRTWVDDETYTPQKQNQDDRNLKRGVEELNSAIVDLEKHYSSSSQPLAKVQGKVWHDSGNAVMKLYHTTNGTPVSTLTKETAYSTSVSTGGTATLKPMGTIDVNTTQATSYAYQLPASTLSSSGQVFSQVCFGSAVTSNASSDIWGLGFAVGDTITARAAFAKAFFVRPTSGNSKTFRVAKSASDANGNSNLVNSNTPQTLNWDSNISRTSNFDGGAGSARIEIAIGKILP